MGTAKEYAIMLETRGFDDIDKYVCEDCLNDAYLKNWICNNGSIHMCDYCKEKKKVVLMTDLMNEVIMPAFRKYYDDADNILGWNGREGGFQGAITYDTNDVCSDFFAQATDNDEILTDIENSLPDKTWCDQNPYGLTEFEICEYSWKSFSELVKYKNRYFFLQEEDDTEYHEKYSPLSILYIIEEQAKMLQLIKILPKDTDLYRVRIFKKEEEIILDGASIGSPPSHLAKNDRMSAAGISVFYGSDNKDICIKEVQGSHLTTEDTVVVGRFNNTNELRYLDLTKICNISLPSIFDLEKYDLCEAVRFFKDLNQKLTQPIEDLKEIEYVPTQIFAEYFKIVAGLNGIKYTSSKDRKGTCYVLFFDNKQCINDETKQIYDKKCELKLVEAIPYQLTLKERNKTI